MPDLTIVNPTQRVQWVHRSTSTELGNNRQNPKSSKNHLPRSPQETPLLSLFCRLVNRPGGFPGGSGVKTPPANAGEVGSTPGLVRSPEGGNGNPLCILASEIQRTEEPGGLQSMGLQESDTT